MPTNYKIIHGDVFEEIDGLHINKTARLRILIEGFYRRAGKKIRIKIVENER